MRPQAFRFSSITSSLSLLALSVLLAGCSTNFGASTCDAAATPIGAIKGRTYGGQQPVGNASISLFAASTTGYGAASTLLASTTTDNGGNFNLTGTYTCIPGTQVYLYANGGNPGGGYSSGNTPIYNPALGFLAVLGQCPAAGTLAGTVPFLIVNEATTVAAAYAFAGFALDATHVGSSGTPLAQVGIANAFLNASNLVNIAQSDRGALVHTPNDNGTVPQAEINTLADILAACVNTAGTPQSVCGTLLGAALSGGTTGTTPGDTATAAINIAHNPAANVAALFAFSSSTPPFEPTLTTAPNDWTVSLSFTGGGMPKSRFFTERTIAVDGLGNVWTCSYDQNTLSELNSLGVPLSGASGYTGSGMTAPMSVAVDTAGNAWIANYVSFDSTLSEFSPRGVPLGNFLGGGTIGNAAEAEFDGFGNIWIASEAYIVEATGTGAYIMEIPSAANGLDDIGAIALGAGPAGTVFVTSYGASDAPVSEFTNAGAFMYSYSSSGTWGAVSVDATGNAWASGGPTGRESNLARITSTSGTPYMAGSSQHLSPVLESLALDGASNVWVTDAANGTIYELNDSGTVLSGTYGFVASGNSGYGAGTTPTITTLPSAIAIDGSGDVWYNTVTDATVRELIGASVPVATPTSYAAAHSKLGQEP